MRSLQQFSLLVAGFVLCFSLTGCGGSGEITVSEPPADINEAAALKTQEEAKKAAANYDPTKPGDAPTGNSSPAGI